MSDAFRVGDRVQFIDEVCEVQAVTRSGTDRPLYDLARDGKPFALGVTENMLEDPPQQTS